MNRRIAKKIVAAMVAGDGDRYTDRQRTQAVGRIVRGRPLGGALLRFRLGMLDICRAAAASALEMARFSREIRGTAESIAQRWGH